MTWPFIATYNHRDFSTDRLVDLKRGKRICVCLPARNEEATIGTIVGAINCSLVSQAGLVDEILVVDDGSSDATATAARSAGARVVATSEVLADPGEGVPGPGKGQAMWKAVYETEGELIVFCDADVSNFDPHFVTGLVGPLLFSERVALVKGTYTRPLNGEPCGGGRVTELMAKPVISVLFPHLAGISQPLAGESAARREVLEQLPFSDGYGVELGLLIDVARRFGVESIVQVDLGERMHRNRPLAELTPQALSILQVALRKSNLRPCTESRDGERTPLVDIPSYRGRTA